QDFRVCEPRQVEVASKVLYELTHADMLTAPKRHSIQLSAQHRGPEHCDKQLFALQLLARSHGQRLSAAREPYRVPLNRRLRRCLLRNEQPLIGLRQSPRHSIIGSLLLRLGLSYLKRAQVQRLLLRKN